MPRSWSTGDGRSFSHVHGMVRTETIEASSCSGDGVLSLTIGDPSKPSDQDRYLLTLKDRTHAELRWAEGVAPAMRLVRVEGAREIATDWDEAKSYSPDDDLSSNPEMKRIFEDDQRVRVNWPRPPGNGDAAFRSDAERREATMKLLKDEALHSGEDFYWAAFIFQHGSTPDDYLLAHTLAMVALEKSYGGALWIATATLDRYLQSVHQPQIYGTQFGFPQDKPTTQEPYNRGLISDSLRRQLGVPVLEDQEKQRKQYDDQRKDH